MKKVFKAIVIAFVMFGPGLIGMYLNIMGHKDFAIGMAFIQAFIWVVAVVWRELSDQS